MTPPDAETTDPFLNGRLQIRQDKFGYRFSVDAALLAWHVHPKPGTRLVDLGTGCGIIPLIVASHCPEVNMVAVELQPRLAELAAHNVRENGLADRIHVVHDDMRRIRPGSLPWPVDWVVTNPPYRRAGSGRINPAPQKALAMHELSVTLTDIVDTATRLVKNRGRISMIYPAERAATLMAVLKERHLEPKRFRMIHSTAGGNAVRILVEAVKNGREGLVVDPPLILYEDHGAYTPEAERMLGCSRTG